MIVAVVLGKSPDPLFKFAVFHRLFHVLARIAFAICWLPIQIVLVLKSIELYNQTNFSIGVQIASQSIAYSSSCVNPLLYAFLSENFRKAFRKVSYNQDKPDLRKGRGKNCMFSVERFVDNG